MSNKPTYPEHVLKAIQRARAESSVHVGWVIGCGIDAVWHAIGRVFSPSDRRHVGGAASARLGQSAH